MASEALFAELARALGQDSRGLRAVKAASEIPFQAMAGYDAGAQFRDRLNSRKLQNQTLSSALGGNIPSGLEGFGNTTVGAATALEKPITAIAALDKARRDGLSKPGETYTPEQTAAVASGDPTQLAKAFGGAVPRTAVAANTTARGITGKNDFFGAKTGQMGLQELPSLLGPNTAPGAAYMVKVSARQGKSLIAKATSPQNLSLAGADLARAVQRSAPFSSTIGESDYGNTLLTTWGRLKQKLDSDPKSPDVPKLRKQLYDTFDELDKASTPWIENHLASYEERMGALSPAERARQLGTNIPEIPFQDTTTGTPPGKVKVSNGRESYFVDPSAVPDAARDGYLPQ